MTNILIPRFILGVNCQVNKKIIKAEEGSALVLVMMVLLVLSVLGAALGVTTIGSLNLSENNQDINSAYYIAQAGANMAYEEIKVEVDNAYEQAKQQTESERSFFNYINGKLSPRNYTDPYFKSTTTSQSKAEVKIIQLGEDTEKESTYKYMIQSTGNVNGKTLTVEKPVDITWKRHGIGEEEQKIWTPNVALTFKESLYVDNISPIGWLKSQIYIYGNIIHDSSTNTPFPGPGSINHRRWINTGLFQGYWHYYKTDKKNIKWEKYDHLISKFPDSPPYYPSDYEHWKLFGLDYYNINSDTYIEEIDTSVLGRITIDTKGETINLVVKNLTLSGAKKLEIKGNGTVNLYVKDQLKFSDFSNLENKNGQLNILYASNRNPVEIYGFAKIKGSLFVKNADIIVGGLTEITDGIISGGNSIKIVGGNEIGGMVYAPYANVQFEGGTEINGIVLARRLYVWGFATINYNGEYIDDFYYYEEVKEDSTIDDLISSEPALEQ